MRKLLVAALLALVATGVNAQDKNAEKKANPNKPVFTVVKENPITSIKNQSRSGTCWDYSTLSFFECEILKATGKTYDLCESFVANKTSIVRIAELWYLPRGRNAIPRQPLRRLFEQLQRVLRNHDPLRNNNST